MRQPIVYVDTSAIREDKLEQVEVAIKNLTAFVEADMPPKHHHPCRDKSDHLLRSGFSPTRTTKNRTACGEAVRFWPASIAGPYVPS
jgi:hypothetical protein